MKWIVAAVIAALLGVVEWATWMASRAVLPAGASDAGRVEVGETILVLGCPLRPLHRWRVRIAVRSTDPSVARFVFSGGAVRTKTPEAQMMADYAVRVLHLPPGNVVVEDASTTTEENIANSAPFLADAPAIKIASNTFHALRARIILRQQSPDLAKKLVRARDYLPFEWGLLHAVLLAYDGYRYVRAGSALVNRWDGSGPDGKLGIRQRTPRPQTRKQAENPT
ncbi:YdcF family protein [Mycobacterium sp. NPDC048908]|uniref:YdcF family protein n=1 Tax=Mycobacterium sp. NPDC048908 TaxID=3364292 RepID=UPI00371928EF